jgi:uncharacterized membrane-anchored protein
MRYLTVLLVLLAGLAAPAWAEEKQEKPLQFTPGPARIAVRDQAVIDLPADYRFIPEASAKVAMERMGNRVDEALVGLIVPNQEADWFIVVEYNPTGHISDDDAKNWNPDNLLSQIRDNTDAENAERRKAGRPELEVIGWAEKPRYDPQTSRLVWSMEARNKGEAKSGESIVNYKTLMLGREGLVSMNMVSPLATIGTDKAYVNLMLSKLDYTHGKKYTDFDVKTDRVAEYGLAALVAGVAVKKLGLIAVITAFLLKSAKVIVIAAAGGIAAFRRLFRRKQPDMPASSPADLPVAPVMTIDAPRVEPQP